MNLDRVLAKINYWYLHGEDDRIHGAIETLRALDLPLPKYGWIGHRRVWFFPTPEDEMLQEEFIESCRE